MLALVSTVILGSDSHGTHNHALLSDGSWSLPNNIDLYRYMMIERYEALIQINGGFNKDTFKL
jgi:hypothetical protein